MEPDGTKRGDTPHCLILCHLISIHTLISVDTTTHRLFTPCFKSTELMSHVPDHFTPKLKWPNTCASSGHFVAPGLQYLGNLPLYGAMPVGIDPGCEGPGPLDSLSAFAFV